MSAPNLDCMDRAELERFALRYDRATPERAAELFPGRPKGYRRAAARLAIYAARKATAMDCRSAGKIMAALDWESWCDSLYERLPDFARW